MTGDAETPEADVIGFPRLPARGGLEPDGRPPVTTPGEDGSEAQEQEREPFLLLGPDCSIDPDAVIDGAGAAVR
jgi:hypothetical protein